jgi:CYTH domain-containing protein
MSHIASETEVKYRVNYPADQKYASPLHFNKPSGAANAVVHIEQTYLNMTATKQFLAEHWPQFLSDIGGLTLKEIRFRCATDQAGRTKNTLTAKTTGSLTRTEVEAEMDNPMMRRLQPFAEGCVITKTRTCVPIPVKQTAEGPAYVLSEVDKFHDNLQGLITIEVEFDPSKYSRAQINDAVRSHYESQDITLTDVTDDSRFKNSNLSKLEEVPSALMKH